jgi:hypothetical protein
MLVALERSLPSEPRSVPHSLSLLQYSLGVGVQANVIRAPLRGYCPFVTAELLELYPDIRRLSGPFSLDG